MEILKFYSKTCGPCKALERNLKQTDIVYKDIEISSEEGMELADKYGIMSIPTLVKIDGDKIDVKHGVISPEDLEKWAQTSI